MLPATRQIFVVFGVSPMERFWSDESRRAFARFENRVQFHWLEKLPAEAMKREVASLPKESVVLYGMLLRDADGLSFEGEDALIRLRAVSSVPVFACFESQMGVGIVGGRLLPDRSLGVKAAEVAARILHGEAPSSIQSPPLEAGPPTFDWRELQHWHIAEDRLPAGSLVLFRPPSFWRLYRWYSTWRPGDRIFTDSGSSRECSSSDCDATAPCGSSSRASEGCIRSPIPCLC